MTDPRVIEAWELVGQALWAMHADGVGGGGVEAKLDALDAAIAALKEPQSSMITCGECGQPFDTYGDGGRKCPKCCGKQSQPAKSESPKDPVPISDVKSIRHEIAVDMPSIQWETKHVDEAVSRGIASGRELERAELRRKAEEITKEYIDGTWAKADVRFIFASLFGG